MASIHIYLKLKLKQVGEVKGEVGHAGHSNEILIEDYCWGQSNSSSVLTGKGGGGDKVHIDDFHFSMRMNKASPIIMQAAATADRVLEAVLSCRSADAKANEDFLKWTLQDGIISSYQVSGGVQEMIPMEHFNIRFRSIMLEFKPRNPTPPGGLAAAVCAKYDLSNMSTTG